MENKVALVTGASRGIGRAIVKQLLGSGVSVCATASTDQGLSSLANEFSDHYGKLHLFPADLKSSVAVQELCASISDQVGHVDVLINNAGVLHLQDIEGSSESVLRNSFEVNFFAPFAITRYFVGSMIKKRSGTIINICSSSSYTGGGAPGHCIYASTKHALLGFSRALDEELRPHNIRVGTVSPAGVSTDMMLRRDDLDHSTFMTPEEVADAVMFLINSCGEGIVYEMRMWRKSR